MSATVRGACRAGVAASGHADAASPPGASALPAAGPCPAAGARPAAPLDALTVSDDKTPIVRYTLEMRLGKDARLRLSVGEELADLILAGNATRKTFRQILGLVRAARVTGYALYDGNTVVAKSHFH